MGKQYSHLSSAERVVILLRLRDGRGQLPANSNALHQA
jgi:hypothetical protein